MSLRKAEKETSAHSPHKEVESCVGKGGEMEEIGEDEDEGDEEEEDNGDEGDADERSWKFRKP